MTAFAPLLKQITHAELAALILAQKKDGEWLMYVNDTAQRAYDEFPALAFEHQAVLIANKMLIERDATFTARIAELEADAERYRWLRDKTGNAIMKELEAECDPDEWDTIIDVARRTAVNAKP